MLRKYHITLLFLFSVPILFCQLQVRNYFNITGKKDVPVNVITQDKTGFLWLGTGEGLYKFDGLVSEPIDIKGILKKEITALHIDKQGSVWIGTRTGKVYIYRENNIDSVDFIKFPNTDKITTFCEMPAGMCIGTYGNGIFTSGKKGLGHYTTEKGLSDNVVYKLESDRKNTIWCATDAGITQVTNIFSNSRVSIISDKTGLPDNIVRDISLQNNRLLIAMQDSGICYFNLIRQEFERMPFFSNWSLGTVVNAGNTSSHQMLIATEKSGLLQIDNGAFSIYKYEDYQIQSINQMYIDRARQLWIASNKGISQFGEKRYNFINIGKGIQENKVLALATDNDNAIWIGTTKGISMIVTNDQGQLVVSKIQDIDKFTISCATRAPDGNIWFGTYGNGIIILNSLTKTSEIINSQSGRIANDNISNIFFSDRNTAYISTLGGGLIKAHIESDDKSKKFEVEKIYTQESGLGSNYVYMALTDKTGRLYAATDGGGLQMLEKNTFTDLTKKYKFASNTVYSMCIDRYHHLWAASNANGILKYDGKEMISINRSNGLRDEQPQQLISTDNTVFAINSKGIDKINCADNTLSYYDLFDGDLEPNLNAIVFGDNKIFSGTNNGVLIYRTNQELLDSLKPSVFIKSIQLNYKRYPIDSVTEFRYNQNNFAIEFNGIWLRNPDKLEYRYKLEGLEEVWNASSEGKVVNYNNLNPGSYKFIVQARNEEDVWSDPVIYNFNIQTPVWKRWWFWVSIIAVGSLGIYFFITYRLKALQKENLLLEKRVKERTSQIEKQSRIIEVKNLELEQLSLVASKTDNVVVILDPDGRLEYINESFFKLNKMTIDDLKRNYGETIYELSNNPDIRQIIDDAVVNRRSVNYESLNRKAEAIGEVWESSTLTPIFDESGALKKIIIIDTDVSVRKKQEQVIIQKNKDITDSISYARKIQHAILPNISLVRKHIPQCFVLYMTKDIVSGDFYWFTHFNNTSIIAAVDCTGHGVPGAFMSLIGYNLLNRIVNERKITTPSEILMELNNGVLGVLHRNESESKDGMDIAICKINHDAATIEYAGAMRPLWIINNGTLEEIKADKIPIGTKQNDRHQTIVYNTHTLEVKKDDTYYIFTDGYADQFGGNKDKKYSTARFKDLLLKNAGLSPAEQEENIKQEHLVWKGDNEQIDDILIIGFKI